MEPKRIRNFCIIAHIDHGKSTLADRLLELTGTISAREAMDQLMDQMDLERERGITIKAKAVRMTFKSQDGLDYELNLIDTPGHVDFSYEVSRSLAACEGAILVVDASQGMQAQTIANVYMALDHNLTIIPFINKIDLPMAEPERVAKELEETLGFNHEEIIFGSAKVGTGARELLEAIVRRVPVPKGDVAAPLRALIFDSKYDSYKGVLAYVRVVDGHVATNQSLRLMFTGTAVDALEVGVFKPRLEPLGRLDVGEVGYVATGLKNVRECQVGDTITTQQGPASEPLLRYEPLKPMVFAGLYPMEGDDYPNLREALDKLRLNDASLSYDPESSAALGHGFRCGFLGLLHMDIVQERLEREFGLKLLATAPSVAYQVRTTDGRELEVDNPASLPEPTQISLVREPWLKVTIITPSRFIGGMMDLVTTRRGEYRRMEYLESRNETVQTERGTDPARDARVLLEYHLPLAEVLVDFYDELKSRTQGYASLDYTFAEYREAPLVKVDVLVNGQPLDALSVITHRDKAHLHGKALVEKLKDLIPRQLFEVALQAAIGGKIIARETVKATRKNVLAKCYGGDITRKRKLLEKQAEGKKRLKKIGHVEIPQEAFFAILKVR